MPVMFFFIFNDYSSGLNYYYFISTLISVLIFVYLRRSVNEEELLRKITIPVPFLVPVEPVPSLKKFVKPQKPKM